MVAWTRTYGDGNTDVLAQKYTATGARLGASFTVAGGVRPESEPDVAMDGIGNFVVSYTVDVGATNRDIHAQQYLWNAGVIPWRGTLVVADSLKNESRSSVARAPDGRFVVAYQHQHSSTDDDIYARRYSAPGDLIGIQTIAAGGAHEQAPSLAVDNHGNAVVAYQTRVAGNYDIKARRMSSTGSVGGEINVRNSSANETSPSVALKRTGGAFVVAYDTGSMVEFAELSSTDVVTRTTFADSGSGPAISLDGLDRFLRSYTGPFTDPTTGEEDFMNPEIYGQWRRLRP